MKAQNKAAVVSVHNWCYEEPILRAARLGLRLRVRVCVCARVCHVPDRCVDVIVGHIVPQVHLCVCLTHTDEGLQVTHCDRHALGRGSSLTQLGVHLHVHRHTHRHRHTNDKLALGPCVHGGLVSSLCQGPCFTVGVGVCAKSTCLHVPSVCARSQLAAVAVCSSAWRTRCTF